jgi:hypothetical protein
VKDDIKKWYDVITKAINNKPWQGAQMKIEDHDLSFLKHSLTTLLGSCECEACVADVKWVQAMNREEAVGELTSHFGSEDEVLRFLGSVWTPT